MIIENFTPGPALAGGLMIGGAAALMMLFTGRITGISGITKGLLAGCPTPRERNWRVAFLVGLVLGGLVMLLSLPQASAAGLNLNPVQMAVGGLLVGVGTAMANGCTSGHGVCGLGRRSARSLAAVLAFMGSGFVTMFLMTQVLGAGRI